MTNLSPEEVEFLRTQHSAAMITVDAAGVAKTARVGIGLVDGRIWSSGTAERVRTRRLRRDPRSTLFVFDGTFRWLSIEATVTILDGPQAPEQNLRLFREMQGRATGPISYFGGELDEEAFLARMVAENRLIYEFEVARSYGVVTAPSF
jgi:hypothetical protein